MKDREEKFAAIGRAYIGRWKAIVAARMIKKGQYKGMYEVSYWDLRTAAVPAKSVRFFNGKP